MTVPPIHDAGQLAGRIKALDGLRALVLLVMGFHFSVEAIRTFEGWFVVPIAVSGLLGIVALDVFFVLSGFLITGILLDTKGAPGFFRNFYARRALRILPLYYGFLLFYLVVLPRLVPWDPVAIELTAGEQAPYWFYFVNLGYGLDWKLAAFTGHYWSLSIEEQFYLVWPLLVFWCTRAQLFRVAIGCLVFSPIVRTVSAFAVSEHFWFFYSFTLARLDGLALGCLLAIAWRDPSRFTALADRLRRAGVWSALAGAGIVAWVLSDLAGTQATPGWRLPLFLTASVWCAGAVVATMLLGRGGIWRRVAESWMARRVGLYSYALYVIHDPLAYVLDQFNWLDRPGPGTPAMELLLYVIAMTTICLVIAAASWHFLERPLLRLRPPQVVPWTAS